MVSHVARCVSSAFSVVLNPHLEMAQNMHLIICSRSYQLSWMTEESSTLMLVESKVPLSEIFLIPQQVVKLDMVSTALACGEISIQNFDPE